MVGVEETKDDLVRWLEEVMGEDDMQIVVADLADEKLLNAMPDQVPEDAGAEAGGDILYDDDAEDAGETTADLLKRLNMELDGTTQNMYFFSNGDDGARGDRLGKIDAIKGNMTNLKATSVFRTGPITARVFRLSWCKPNMTISPSVLLHDLIKWLHSGLYLSERDHVRESRDMRVKYGHRAELQYDC